MKRKSSLALVLMALLMAFPAASAFADKITPTHSCTQPSRPFKFKSESEVNAYKAEVEKYRKCISDFVEEQNQAIQKHRDAANRAIEEYNFFVSMENRK